MELSTITEDPHVARRAFLDYRKAVREPVRSRFRDAEHELRAIDQELMRAYRELAKGVSLIRLSETIKAGGFKLHDRDSQRTALPNIAIAPADARRVICTGVHVSGRVLFSTRLLERPWRALSTDARHSVELSDLFERPPGAISHQHWQATVPTVPPQFRPRSLTGYHVLFEAEWQEAPQPADPALLKHLGGDLWAVVATWDLTPLEAAVLGQRR
jgi:hypothetical protein